MKALGIVIAIWFLLGAVIAGERGHYSTFTCDSVGTIAVTAALGPIALFVPDPDVNCALF